MELTKKMKLTEKEMIKKEGAGELKYINGMPFLKVVGTHYEMGRQYGTLLKAELREVYEQIDLLQKAVLSTISRLFWPLVHIFLRLRLSLISLRLPADYKDELRGIAAGAKLKYEDVLYMALFLEVTTGTLNSVASFLAEADCSTLLFKKEGRILHGRNFDFLPLFLGDYTIIVEYQPEGKQSYTSMGIIGYPGVFTGVNEAGMSTTLNISVGYKRQFRAVPITYKVRQILENCTTLADVDHALKGYKIEVPMLLTVGSQKDNDGAIYDLGLTGFKKNRLGEKEYIFACNRFLDEELSRQETPLTFGTSYLNVGRMDMIQQYLDQGVDNVEDILEVLGCADLYQYPDVIGTHNGTINNERTLHTVVFDLAQMNMYFAADAGYAAWSDIWNYDLQSRSVNPYQPGSVKRENPLVQQYLEWYDDVFVLFMKKDFKQIEERTLQFPEFNRAQMIMLDMAWKKMRKSVNLEALFQILETSIKKYPQCGFFYKYKGRFLLSLGKVDEAIGSLEQALVADILFPPERMETYELLVEAHQIKGEPQKVNQYADSCLQLLEKHREDFAWKKAEKKLAKKMRKAIAD